jgi:hypothetical protein
MCPGYFLKPLDADAKEPVKPIEISPFTVDTRVDEETHCFRQALTNPSCAVCLQIQRKVAKWGTNPKLLRRALCGRWDLLQSLRKLDAEQRR